MDKANLLASEIKARYGVGDITVQGSIDCEEDVKYIFREVSGQLPRLDITGTTVDVIGGIIGR